VTTERLARLNRDLKAFRPGLVAKLDPVGEQVIVMGTDAEGFKYPVGLIPFDEFNEVAHTIIQRIYEATPHLSGESIDGKMDRLAGGDRSGEKRAAAANERRRHIATEVYNATQASLGHRVYMSDLKPADSVTNISDKRRVFA